MSVNEGPLQARWSDRLPVPSEDALLVAIASGFLLVHILAGMLLMQVTAGVATPPQEQARPSYSD
jgi:hypothetical protein